MRVREEEASASASSESASSESGWDHLRIILEMRPVKMHGRAREEASSASASSESASSESDDGESVRLRVRLLKVAGII